jgi:CBS domain-containing protein
MDIGQIASTSVLMLGPDVTLKQAAQAMVDRHVGSAVIVTEQGYPAIITERDLMRATAAGADPEASLVEEFMTADAITASQSWDVVEASEEMRKGGFRHLIVLDQSGNIAGVVSMRDLLEALLDQASQGVVKE